MHTHTNTHELSYLRSFWLIKPWLNWSTTVLNIALASLAKSRSLISITGTETMAKASLSSLVGHVPNCRRTGDKREVDFTPETSGTLGTLFQRLTMSLMGLSSSMSMGTLVLWIQVLVQRCRRRT